MQFIVLIILESAAMGYFENIPYLLLVLLYYNQKHFDLYNTELMFPLIDYKEESCSSRSWKPVTRCTLFPVAPGFTLHRMR